MLVLFLLGLSVFKFYGEADASSMWNYYARFLYFEDYWRGLFVETTLGNKNHPLLLSSITAFLWRITNSYPAWLIPQLLGWLPAVLLPALLFLYFYKKSAWLAFGLMLLLCGHLFFLNMAVNQYADIWVSFYFFLSVLCLLQWRQTRNCAWLWLWASSLGAAAFTKNEGIMLCVLSVMVLVNDWRRHPIPVLLGILPFLGCIAAHKLFFHIQSPVAATWNDGAFALLQDRQRALLIVKYLEDNLSGTYSVMTWGLIAVLLNYLRQRLWPDTLWFLILLSIGGYAAVYLTLTENGLEWNLATSMERVLLHVMPASYLVAAALLLQPKQQKISKQKVT